MGENSEINLRDFIWETEEHRFDPKPDTHSNTRAMKQREAKKKANSTDRKVRTDPEYFEKKKAAEKKLRSLELKEHIESIMVE